MSKKEKLNEDQKIDKEIQEYNEQEKKELLNQLKTIINTSLLTSDLKSEVIQTLLEDNKKIEILESMFSGITDPIIESIRRKAKKDE